MENPDSNVSVGERFQEGTKYRRPTPSARKLGILPESNRDQRIFLPPPPEAQGPGLWKILRNRRSVRDYAPEPLAANHLSALLWATQGITRDAPSPCYRTAPSAGALHPIDTYLVVNRVEGLTQGVYFFNVGDFTLTMKRRGDFSAAVRRAALEQGLARSAAIVFVWVAVIRRCSWKYRQRAYRYIYLDCGHIAQNLYLAATAMDLGCCAIAAFFDDEVNDLTGVDGREETAIYMAAVGKK